MIEPNRKHNRSIKWKQVQRASARSQTVLAKGLVMAFLLSAVLILGWCLQGGLEKELVPSYSAPRSHWQELRGPLIHTHWKQDGPYATMVPGGELLGCWSVAFAQVLAYHRLQPKGRVKYETRRGIIIDETLTHPFNWDRLVSAIGPDTPSESRSDTARYCFNAALVVQKDFGGGEYRNIARVPNEISEHYGCGVERVDSGLAETARSELRSARPLIAYFNDILQIRIVRTGHAAVLDGMAEVDNRLFAHVNFGWGGASDGWYDFQALAEDRNLLYLFLVIP
jgi:hypothetical protein